MSEATNSDQKATRVAVLLFGLLREYKTAAPSFLRHVVQPNDAAVFYFGPAETDAPNSAHKGQNDIFDSMINNPKAEMGTMMPVNPSEVSSVYGQALKASRFHSEPQATFADASTKLVARDEWLFQMNPARMFSMFYNMQGVVRLYLEHEKLSGESHDTIIITRPDLAFFSPLLTDDEATIGIPGEVHIPQGEGFTDWGEKHTGNAPVLHYKNVLTGDFIPGGRKVSFNDQVMILSRSDLEALGGIYDALLSYMEAKVPASPETVLHLHLAGRSQLVVVPHPEWLYEIYRSGARQVQSVLNTSEIMFIDRRNKSALEFRSKRPVQSALRDAKVIYRKIKHRILR